LNSKSAAADASSSMARPASRAAQSGLLEAAEQALAPVAFLLSHFRAPLLTVSTRRSERCTRTRLVLWANDFSIGDDIEPRVSDSQRLREARIALQGHGCRLYRELARRWPANAVPPAIGVVTDGTGMAISSSHPSALSRSWLSEHLANLAPVCVLIPFHSNGPWALLSRSKDEHLLN
jgi:hypothetical protein